MADNTGKNNTIVSGRNEIFEGVDAFIRFTRDLKRGHYAQAAGYMTRAGYLLSPHLQHVYRARTKPTARFNWVQRMAMSMARMSEGAMVVALYTKLGIEFEVQSLGDEYYPAKPPCKKKGPPKKDPALVWEEKKQLAKAVALERRGQLSRKDLSDKLHQALKDKEERKINRARSRSQRARVEFLPQAGVFGSISHRFTSTLEQAGESLGRGVSRGVRQQLGDDIQSTIDSVKNNVRGGASEGLNNLVTLVKDSVASISSVILKVAGIAEKMANKLGKYIMAAVSVAVMFAVAKHAGISGYVFSHLCTALGMPGVEFEPQFGEKGETESIGRAMFAAALVAIAPSFGATSKAWMPLVGLLTKAAPFTSGCKNIVDWILESIQWIINQFLRIFGCGEITWFRRRFEQIDEWLKKSHDILKKTPSEHDEVVVLRHWDEGHELAKTSVGKIIKVELDHMLRSLASHFNFANSARELIKSARPEPLCVVLEGKPGIGKSILMDKLHWGITLKTDPDILFKYQQAKAEGFSYPMSKHAYVKDKDRFWSGYNPAVHTTMMLDDGGTALPVPGVLDSDFIMLMRIINSAPAALESAIAEDKGSVFFRSSLVLISTNLNEVQWRSYAERVISNPDALSRRMQLFLNMEIADERFIKDNKLNVEAYNAATPSERDRAFKFVGTYRNESVSFYSVKELVEFSSRHMNTTRDHFHKLRSMVEEDIDEMFFPQASVPGNSSPHESWYQSYTDAMSVFIRYYNLFVPLQEMCDEFSTTDWLVAGATFGAAIYVVYKAIRGLVSLMWSFFSNKKRRSGKVEDYTPQAQDPEPFFDIVGANMYALSVRRAHKENPTSILGSILMVDGNFALMPYHFLVCMTEFRAKPEYAGSCPTMRSMKTGVWLDMDWDLFQCNGSNVMQLVSDDGTPQDLAIVRLGGQPHRRITGFMLPRGCRKPMDLGWIDVNSGMSLSYDTLKFDHYLQDFRYKGYFLSEAVMYNKATSVGDCGSVIMSLGESGRVNLIGMHTAGDSSGNFGVAGIVYKDQVELAISTISMRVKITSAITVRSTTQEGFEPQTGPLGELSVALTAYRNGKPDKPGGDQSMAVCPDLIGWADELCPLVKVPADCSESATGQALLAYTHPCKFPVNSFIGEVAEVVCTSALNDMGVPATFNDRILTFTEAITGLAHGVRFAEPINHKTSTGYPFQNLGLTKGLIFDSNGNICFSHPATKAIREECDFLLNSMLEGEDIMVKAICFKVSPKRELRPPGKAPRVIQAAPIHLVIVFRMLFWAFMGHFAEWSPEKELAIGLDPYRHWHRLKEWVTSKQGDLVPHDMVGAGDYSKFDQCHEPTISSAIGRSVLARYSRSSYQRCRSMLWSTLCGPQVVFKNVVYKFHKGLPSGHPATSIVNGLYNATLFRMAFVSQRTGGCYSNPFPMAMEVIKRTAQTFRQHVALSVCGDDNLFGTDEPDFNELALTELMSRFGANYTLDQKDQRAVALFRDIKEVSFLGRSFRFENELLAWVAPLRLESIAMMGQYSEKLAQQYDPTWGTSIARQVFSELSLHPHEVWKEWMPLAISAFCFRTLENGRVRGYVDVPVFDCSNICRIMMQPSHDSRNSAKLF